MLKPKPVVLAVLYALARMQGRHGRLRPAIDWAGGLVLA